MTLPALVEKALLHLVPSGTGVAACLADERLLQQLSAEERALVASARWVRRSEFAAGRWCAHRSLAAIGADVDSIGRGARRQPAWPDGVTGSISHAAGLAVAVAAPITPSLLGVGIDVERAAQLGDEAWAHVLTPAERTVCEQSDDPGAAAASIFSTKEAAFKAIYPLLGEEVDFLEAHSDVGARGRVEIPRLGVCSAFRQGRVADVLISVAVVGPG